MRISMGVFILFIGLVSCGESPEGEKKALEDPKTQVTAGQLNHDLLEERELTREEQAQMREFASSNDRKLGLVLYDGNGQVINADLAFPREMASASICRLSGNGELAKVRYFKSCCDKIGSEVIDLPKLNQDCWSVQNITCENARYSVLVTFKDGDKAEYKNSKLF